MTERIGVARNTGPESAGGRRQDPRLADALPASMTSFIGRSRELPLFQEGKRLVTLAGIGGIGKIRLARSADSPCRLRPVNVPGRAGRERGQ